MGDLPHYAGVARSKAHGRRPVHVRRSYHARLWKDIPVDYPTVTLGPFHVVDLERSALRQHLVTHGLSRQFILFSLHVGGLNLRNDPEFAKVMATGDLVVPDGISVALLARIAGASGLHRHPTTDLGWELLDDLHGALARPVRVALIGGPAGLAEKAASAFATQGHEVVHISHGYHDEWGPVAAAAGEAHPDVVFVGMGMPTEAYWVAEHREALGDALVVTCGGWFGHIAGVEKRAPAWMRRAGLEWLARLVQQPGRLWKRYAGGAFATAAMVAPALGARRRRKVHNVIADSEQRL